MNITLRIIAIVVFISSSLLLYAQQEERLLHEDKQTIYSKLQGQEGHNINLTLQLYTNDKIKLKIESSNGQVKKDTTLEVHELSILPVQNIILQTLHGWRIGDGKLITDVLESQSISTISLMVLTAQIKLTGLNNIDRSDITSTFSFKMKIPLFIDADTTNINKLFRLVGYDGIKPKHLKDIQTKTNDSIDSTSKEIQNLKKSESNSKDTVNKSTINIEKTKLNELVEKSEMVQLMIDNKKKNKFLVGFAFVDRNEVVIDNCGFIRTIRISLTDSLESY